MTRTVKTIHANGATFENGEVVQKKFVIPTDDIDKAEKWAKKNGVIVDLNNCEIHETLYKIDDTTFFKHAKADSDTVTQILGNGLKKNDDQDSESQEG